MTKCARPLIASLLVALSLTGCTIANGPTSSKIHDPTQAQTAVVSRQTVVGVLTLKGTVAQGALYKIHTRLAGIVTDVDTTSVTVLQTSSKSKVRLVARDGDRITQTLVAVGDPVVPGMAVADAIAPGFSISTALKPADLVRFVAPPLGAKAQVDGGPGPFACPLVDETPTTSSDAADAVPRVLCAVPSEARVLAGMTATVVIQLENAPDALALPVEAVAGTIDAGIVYLRDKTGKAVQTPVKLGTTDGVHIVILGGLKAGDVVLVPGPWLGREDG